MVTLSDELRISPEDGLDLQSLVGHRTSIQGTSTVEEAYQSFKSHAHEYVAVLSDKKVIGVISRGQIGFLLGSQFGFAIYAKRQVRYHLAPHHLRIYTGTPLTPVLEQSLSRTGEAFYDDVVLVASEDEYLGMISVETLVRLQSKLMAYKAAVSDFQQRALEEKNKQLFRSLNQLRQSQGRYETLFENHALGVALIDSQGNVETRNKRFAELIGEKPVLDLDRRLNIAEMIAPLERVTFLNLLQRHEDEPHGVFPRSNEFHVQLPGRGLRQFKFFIRWIHETGQICICVDDVTEQRILERRFSQKEKAALLESLVGGIAHEINNKLAPVVGYAELLVTSSEQLSKDDNLRHYCATIRDCALESAKIIRQLLHLSKPPVTELLPCDLRSLIRDALAILKLRFRESQVHPILYFPENEAVITADPSQIKQVAINLVLNALDAMQESEKKELAISIQQIDDNITLDVGDSGHGIRPDHINRVFDPFFTTKAPDRGSGLGLSVCFSIVKQHGGEISVESKVGEGTVFRVSFPKSNLRPEPTQQSRTEGTERPLQRSRSRVLVVDDEEFVSGFIQEVLRSRLNCTVVRANNGEQAKRSIEENDFDLIISDVRMPGMNGLALLEWIRTHRNDLADRFFFTTGDAGSSDLNAKVETLGVPVLRKPFTTETLMKQCKEFALS